jgi:hypothetical protein
MRWSGGCEVNTNRLKAVQLHPLVIPICYGLFGCDSAREKPTTEAEAIEWSVYHRLVREGTRKPAIEGLPAPSRFADVWDDWKACAGLRGAQEAV